MANADGRVHVHVFTHADAGSPAEILEAAAELGDPRVRFASQFVGSFQVYAHLVVASLAEAMGLANALWPKGFRTEMSTEVRVSRLRGPKRGSPDLCALVRIRPEDDPFTLLDRLDDAFESGFDGENYGAAVVTGRGYDLLVDLGRPTWDELVAAVVQDLREVPGIGRTDTSWADLRVNPFRNPPA